MHGQRECTRHEDRISSVIDASSVRTVVALPTKENTGKAFIRIKRYAH